MAAAAIVTIMLIPQPLAYVLPAGMLPEAGDPCLVVKLQV